MNQKKLLFLFFVLTLVILLLPSKAQTLNNLSCEPGCLTCSSPEICTDCDSRLILTNGKCLCEPPQDLIPNNHESPWQIILKSSAFWIMIGSSVLFLFLLCWLHIPHPTYCALLANKDISKKSLFRKTNLLFWLVHPLIGIYLYNDLKINKTPRLAIYYQRWIIIMIFCTIFSLISAEEESVPRAYIILYNLLIALPINSLLNKIFTWTFRKQELKKHFAIVLYILFLTVCLAYIFIIETQQDESSWNKDWAINFAISLMQDLTLTPFISIILGVLFIKLSKNKKETPKFIVFHFKNFKFIYTLIFVNPPICIESQAPLPPEIASPMSTSRKLLKISDLSLPSPVSHKRRSRRIIRARATGVSDTELGNIDTVAAADTLATERLEILFSEGKRENVKENSPTKGNYDKMQSANVASAKLSSPTGVGNSNNISINCETRFMSRPTDLPTPLNEFSELAIQIRPEDIVFSPIGSPRETSSP